MFYHQETQNYSQQMCLVYRFNFKGINMSIITNIINSLSEADKAKLGRVGTKVNTDGAHSLTIVEAYEIASEGGVYPRFVLKMEDQEGKTLDWTGFLKQQVGKDDKGVIKAGEYSVNGVKTYLDKEGAEYDNLRVIGQINNLWKIVGLDANQFGAGIKPGTVTFPEKGTQAIESWTAFIGKKFTGVTSYVISMDKDGKKAWRNQDINMNALFTADGLSLAEKEAGKTEGTALAAAVTAAKAAATIKHNDKNNKIAIQELKLVQSGGTVPATESAPVAQSAVSPF
jgi:hypothetical protein